MSDYQDENSEEERTTRLDIARYLSELSKELEDAPEEGSAIAESKSQQDSEDAADEYTRLAQAGEWQKLLELTESEFSKGSVEAKIWWVASQYHLKLMPVGLLAAPLEAASAEIVDSDSNAEILKTTEELLVSIGKKLFEENDFELGDILYKRALKLNPALSEGYATTLKKLKTREEKSPTTVDSIKRLSFLQEKMKELPNDDSFTEDETEPLLEEKISDKSKNSSLVNGILLLMLLALVVFGAYKMLPLLNGSVVSVTKSEKVAYEVLDEEVIQDFNLRNPDLKPELVPDAGSLGGILRALNDQKHGSDNVSEKKVEDSTNEAQVTNLQKQEVVKNNENVSTAVNTQGPLEPEIVRQIMNNGTIDELPNTIHEDGFDRINKPILGTMDKTKPIVPAYVIPPKPVEETAKMYEIKEYTEIRGEPNMTAPVLEKLITGDRVRVAEKFGRWARIVSKGGRDGYIQKSALGREI